MPVELPKPQPKKKSKKKKTKPIHDESKSWKEPGVTDASASIGAELPEQQQQRQSQKKESNTLDDKTNNQNEPGVTEASASWKFQFTSEAAIPWGGTYKGIKMINTCTIYVGLQVFPYLVSFPNALNQLQNLAEIYPPIKVLLRALKLISECSFAHAKWIWFEEVLKEKPRDECLNAYGSELDKFVQHIASIQHAKYNRQCQNKKCIRNKRQTVSVREMVLK